METLTSLITTTFLLLIPLLVGYILGKDRDSNKTLFNKKLEIYSDIVYYINSHKYILQNNSNNNDIIKLFAPARLIGSKVVLDELRNYFSLISDHNSNKEKGEDTKKLENDISKSAMELEQRMRKDLGYFRNLSKETISSYFKK